MQNKQPDAPKRPGFMLYFQDLGSMLEELDNENLGIMLRAMYQYALDGDSPEFNDRFLRIYWHYVKEALDRDAEAYAKIKENNKRKAYLRSWYAYAAEHGLDKQDEMERDKWIDRKISLDENNL